MIAYDEALARMLAAVAPLPGETVEIEQARGRYLAEPVRAAIDAPRHDVSMMDGYATRHADAVAGGWQAVVGEAAPGAPFAGSVGRRETVRIFTGAHVPAGADCVVIQENAEREGDRVQFGQEPGPDRYIRQQGSDFRAGDTILAAGARLLPTALVALAGADRAKVSVARRPRVAMVATGDELVGPGSAAATPHAIPDSASIGVAAMVAQGGGALAGRARGRDRLEELTALAEAALAGSDLVVVLGGASVGDRDFAKPMFGDLGLDLHFSKVAIRPGKPVWFGKVGETCVLGLPGNPGSAMVTARLFLAPLLAALQGGAGKGCVTTFPQRLAADLPPSGMRETFTRARLGEDGLSPVPNQDSGAQSPLAASDWLIRRAPGDGARRAGEWVRAMPF